MASVSLDDGIHKDFKVFCSQNDRDMKECANEAINEWMERQKKRK